MEKQELKKYEVRYGYEPDDTATYISKAKSEIHVQMSFREMYRGLGLKIFELKEIK